MRMEIIFDKEENEFVNKIFENRSRDLQRVSNADHVSFAEAADICFSGISQMKIAGPDVNPYNVAYVHGCILAWDLWFRINCRLRNQLDLELPW